MTELGIEPSTSAPKDEAPASWLLITNERIFFFGDMDGTELSTHLNDPESFVAESPILKTITYVQIMRSGYCPRPSAAETSLE